MVQVILKRILYQERFTYPLFWRNKWSHSQVGLWSQGKSTSKLKSVVADEIKLWGLGFKHDYYNLHPSKICWAFSRLKKKKVLLPEKGTTRVARDAAIVHPPFWDRLQIQIFNISQCQQLYMNFCHFGHLTHIFHLIPDGRQHTQPGWLFGSSSKAGGPSSCSTNCPLALSSNISATIPLWFGCFPCRHLDKRNPSKPWNRK